MSSPLPNGVPLAHEYRAGTRGGLKVYFVDRAYVVAVSPLPQHLMAAHKWEQPRCAVKESISAVNLQERTSECKVSRDQAVNGYTRPAMNAAALIFDAYGTLFDIASLADACAGVAPDPARLVTLWRAKQLEYTFLRALIGPAAYVDFWQVTADALDFAAQQLELTLSGDERRRALDGWLGVRPYPEVGAVLRRLRNAGRQCIILSNGSPSMLKAAVAGAGLAEHFWAVLSVDTVRTYKPDPRVYQLAVDALGRPAEELIFVSSNGWDAAGARAFGYRVVWVNRAGAPIERLGFLPDFTMPDLSELT